jgi:hypothetical protein
MYMIIGFKDYWLVYNEIQLSNLTQGAAELPMQLVLLQCY